MFQKILIAILITLTITLSLHALTQREVSVMTNSTSEKIRSREKMVGQTLASEAFLDFTNQKLSISIDEKLTEPRGRMKGRSITLSALVDRDSEFLKLFVHEFAHFVDIYVYASSRGVPDISNDFYRISWEKPTIKRAGQKQGNFVSGYAATNQYEDFAESFVFYIFHNRAFEERALRDDVMREKYLFFRNNIFTTGVFVDTDYTLGRVPSYTWDTTKLPISLQKYLYSLN